MMKNKNKQESTYCIQGFGLNGRCGHNENVTWTQRVPVYFGQPVFDLLCECGATSIRMTYAPRKRR